MRAGFVGFMHPRTKDVLALAKGCVRRNQACSAERGLFCETGEPPPLTWLVATLPQVGSAAGGTGEGPCQHYALLWVRGRGSVAGMVKRGG